MDNQKAIELLKQKIAEEEQKRDAFNQEVMRQIVPQLQSFERTIESLKSALALLEGESDDTESEASV